MSTTRRSRLVVTGITLIVCGFLLAALGGVGAAVASGRGFLSAVTGPVESTPVAITRSLTPGSYVVYQRTGWSHRVGPISGSYNGEVTIGPRDVTVLDPAGTNVSVTVPTFSQTIGRDGAQFTGAVEFVADQPGVYQIQVREPGQQVIVAPSFGTLFARASRWLAALAIGGLLAVAGLVLLIVGLVQKRPVAAPTAVPAAFAAAPAAAWYPDPTGQARLRWWDGTRWTDHTAS